MKKDKQIVAMTHEFCPICGAEMNETIALSMRLQDISHLNGKGTGYANKPCTECQKIFDLGAIALIIADRDKSGSTPEELYRCGHVFGVTEDYAKRVTQHDPELQKRVLEMRLMVMDYRMAKQFGFEINYPRV